MIARYGQTETSCERPRKPLKCFQNLTRTDSLHDGKLEVFFIQQRKGFIQYVKKFGPGNRSCRSISGKRTSGYRNEYGSGGVGGVLLSGAVAFQKVGKGWP